MMSHSALVLCLLFTTVSSNLAIAIKKEKRPPQTLSRGWGDDITWVQTYEEGLFHTQKSNKPLMVIHHLEDCQYCQALKKVFAQNTEIQEMAQNNFIMLNLMHETTDKNLSPDGQYVPRIMFVGNCVISFHQIYKISSLLAFIYFQMLVHLKLFLLILVEVLFLLKGSH
ncbi:anterior gradient protein 3 isoform X1 [Ovis aries]|uniref:anterior gradient protein 3 isoform X1 n=1 Tax=Ovis aries TaxID=9940 RepID=UPI0029527073|nr:anterior gradient protein 3 isoform X1 [Ovis aries]